jgi:peptide-methionine (S)-S-oxide reductase
MNLSKIILFITIFAQIACSQTNKKSDKMNNEKSINNDNLEIATLGAGCFWCVEAVFQDLKGVEKVVSGYSGGLVKNPSYREVCNGTTGHAEVVQITFNPEVISFEVILELFWATHDPTTLNRQGGDVGTQYRSAIFYHNDSQKIIAEKSKVKADQSGDYNNPIVTEITEFTNFYPAEDYHQDYFNLNGDKNPYCSSVIAPKIAKFRKKYADRLK